ncbi:hypothetical protein STEG23_014177 [Scotinomys teguina]
MIPMLLGLCLSCVAVVLLPALYGMDLLSNGKKWLKQLFGRRLVKFLKCLKKQQTLNSVHYNVLSTNEPRFHFPQTQDAPTESLPCRQQLSFLQKNIIIAAIAVAAILLVTVFVVLVLVTYMRRKQPKIMSPPLNTQIHMFLMAEEKQLPNCPPPALVLTLSISFGSEATVGFEVTLYLEAKEENATEREDRSGLTVDSSLHPGA